MAKKNAWEEVQEKRETAKGLRRDSAAEFGRAQRLRDRAAEMLAEADNLEADAVTHLGESITLVAEIPARFRRGNLEKGTAALSEVFWTLVDEMEKKEIEEEIAIRGFFMEDGWARLERIDDAMMRLLRRGIEVGGNGLGSVLVAKMCNEGFADRDMLIAFGNGGIEAFEALLRERTKAEDEERATRRAAQTDAPNTDEPPADEEEVDDEEEAAVPAGEEPSAEE